MKKENIPNKLLTKRNSTWNNKQDFWIYLGWLPVGNTSHFLDFLFSSDPIQKRRTLNQHWCLFQTCQKMPDTHLANFLQSDRSRISMSGSANDLILLQSDHDEPFQSFLEEGGPKSRSLRRLKRGKFKKYETVNSFQHKTECECQKKNFAEFGRLFLTSEEKNFFFGNCQKKILRV